jgi:hypothetical protein
VTCDFGTYIYASTHKPCPCPQAAGEHGSYHLGFRLSSTLKLQESTAGDGLEAALADAQLQRDCQQRLAALVGVLRADHLQVDPCVKRAQFMC